MLKFANKIAVFSQKGGVGKTTTALNLGGALARAGLRPLWIDPVHLLGNFACACIGFDLDPQRSHRPHVKASGWTSRANSSSPARVAGCRGSNGWRTASLLITPPSSITVFVARNPHCLFS